MQGRVSGPLKNVLKPCAKATIFGLKFLNGMGILYGRLYFQAVWDNTNVLPKSLHVSWSHSNNGIYFPIIEGLSNPIPICLYHFPVQSSLEHQEVHDFGQAVVVVSIRFPRWYLRTNP